MTSKLARRSDLDDPQPLISIAALPEVDRFGARGSPAVRANVARNLMSLSLALGRAAIAMEDTADDARRRERMLAMETHELKQPLASIRQRLESTSIDPVVGFEIDQVIDRMLMRIENNLYRWKASHSTSLDSAEARASGHEFDAIELLRRVVAEFNGKYSTRSVVATLSSTGSFRLEFPAPVFGVQRWLSLALGNVLDNAAKFGEGRPVDILVHRDSFDRGAMREEAIVIEVADRGIGIPEDQLKSIFNAGHRNPHSRVYVATGSQFALSVSRHAVESEFRGLVWARSPGPGKGSSFFVKLPLVSRSRDES